MIDFFVEGQPVPQGSMRVFNGNVVHTRGAALAVWRSAIAIAARKAGAVPVDGPIALALTFTYNKPKTVKRDLPSIAPDLDKQIRSVLDALTAIAYKDDGQVCEIYARKEYGDVAGVRIRIGGLSVSKVTQTGSSAA